MDFNDVRTNIRSERDRLVRGMTVFFTTQDVYMLTSVPYNKVDLCKSTHSLTDQADMEIVYSLQRTHNVNELSL